MSIVWIYKRSILALTILMMGVALVVSSRQAPVYESTVEVLMGSVSSVSSGAVIPRPPNLATEAEIASSGLVALIVAENEGLDGDPAALLNGLVVDRPSDAAILEITYRHTDPVQASRRAQGFADGYLEYRQDAFAAELARETEAIVVELRTLRGRLTDIEDDLAGLDEADPLAPTLESEAALIRQQILQQQLARLGLTVAPVRVGEIVQPAAVPEHAVSPDHGVNVGFGLVAGLVVGIGLAFFRDGVSGQVRSVADIENQIAAPVLGAIPKVRTWRKRKRPFLVTLRRWRAPAAEAYRALRNNMVPPASERRVKSVVVTSAHDGEGKSTTVANLGVALARGGKRVTLVSADLRRPRLHAFFGLDAETGLIDVIERRIPLRLALREVPLPGSPWINLSATHLRVLPSGPVPAEPTELLSSQAMRDVLRTLEESSDIVLIDAPPVASVADPLVLAHIADGVLVVIGGRTAHHSLRLVRTQLDNVGTPVLGAVLNVPDPSIA